MIKRLGRRLKINRIQFLRNLYDKYLKLKLPDRETFVSIDGHKMLIWNPKRVGMGKSIYLSGMWEPQVTEYISQKIEKGMTVLDIGADIGYYTLLFAKRVLQCVILHCLVQMDQQFSKDPLRFLELLHKKKKR
jgi:protein-L-isoaspartate O-methyltransferase